MYTALYRKWRPKKFEDICGQEHINISLRNQVKLDRLSHAYLFCGTRGTGKTSTAKILAKAANCLDLKDGNPCEVCESCVSINEGNSIDVFEIDAASNRGVDDIRDLREAVKFTPVGKYKLYIIDEVHMLTNVAFNALLKTLEEPPPYVIFILATTEPHKLPATILSRCQRFDFKRISKNSMIKHLKFICNEEDIIIDTEALETIVRNSDGAMRDAISVLDQCAIYSNKNIKANDVSIVLGIVDDKYIFEIADSILEEDITKTIKLLKEISDDGKDMLQFAYDLQFHYRNLLIAKLVPQAENVLDLSAERVELLKKYSRRYSRDGISRCINILSDSIPEIKWSSNPALFMEITLLKMSRLEKDISSDGIIARVEKLEQAIKSGKQYNETIADSDNEEDLRLDKGKTGTEDIIKEERGKAGTKDITKKEKGKVDAEDITKKEKGKVDAEDVIKEDKGKADTEDIIKKDIKKEKPEIIQEEADKDNLEKQSVNCKRIVEEWDSFIFEIGKKKKMKIRTYLSPCKPIMLNEKCLYLCFEEEDKFFKESIQDAKIISEIENLICEYFDTPIKIKPAFKDEIKKNDDKTEVMYESKSNDNDNDLKVQKKDALISKKNSNVIDEKYVIDKAIELFGEDLVEIIEE